MREDISIRPMTPDDVDSVYLSNSLAFAGSPEEEREVHERSPEEVEWHKGPLRHLVGRDPGGCHVAVDDERIAGSALSFVREGVWVLGILVVGKEYRGKGVGRALLSRAMEYAEGTKGGMIASSSHPAAMRSYALAGFTLLPTLKATGSVKREGLPEKLAVREGTPDDLDLAADVDRALRGAAHGPDLEFMLSGGSRPLVEEPLANQGFMLSDNTRLLVAERGKERGYALANRGSLFLLGATEPALARELLFACLAEAAGEVMVRFISAAQSPWATPTVLEAGLSLQPAGPLCVHGELGPLAPYLPNALFL
jgi:GNAT superfamily N-acetyltransferase